MHAAFNNLALVYWKLKANEDADNCLQQSILYLEMLIRQCQYKEEHIFFTIELIKLSLQHCVILSHAGTHASAIDTIDRIIGRLIECFQVMSAVGAEMTVAIKNSTPR